MCKTSNIKFLVIRKNCSTSEKNLIKLNLSYISDMLKKYTEYDFDTATQITIKFYDNQSRNNG